MGARSPVFEWGSGDEYLQFMKLISVRDVTYTVLKNANKPRTSGRRVNVDGNVERPVAAKRTKSGVALIATGAECGRAAGVPAGTFRSLGEKGPLYTQAIVIVWIAYN